MLTQFWEKHLEKGHLEDPQGNKRIIINYFFGICCEYRTRMEHSLIRDVMELLMEVG
jgi:hypothetical protein